MQVVQQVLVLCLLPAAACRCYCSLAGGRQGWAMGCDCIVVAPACRKGWLFDQPGCCLGGSNCRLAFCSLCLIRSSEFEKKFYGYVASCVRTLWTPHAQWHVGGLGHNGRLHVPALVASRPWLGLGCFCTSKQLHAHNARSSCPPCLGRQRVRLWPVPPSFLQLLMHQAQLDSKKRKVCCCVCRITARSCPSAHC